MQGSIVFIRAKSFGSIVSSTGLQFSIWPTIGIYIWATFLGADGQKHSLKMICLIPLFQPPSPLIHSSDLMAISFRGCLFLFINCIMTKRFILYLLFIQLFICFRLN